MAWFKDIVNFIFPVPPNGTLPNCPRLFLDLSKSRKKNLKLGRLFCRLCRLTALVWYVWGVHFLLFCFGGALVLYHWGWRVSMDDKIYFKSLSCKMIVAMIAAIVFVSKTILFGMSAWAVQLKHRCLEYI
jgi:hypothetical protein